MSFWKTASLDHVKQYDTDASALPLGSASVLVERSGILAATGALDVLDNACGTGIVSEYLMNNLPANTRDSLRLTMADIGQNMVDAARAKAEKNGWKADVKVVDMQSMDVFPEDSFDYILINQGIQFAPNADATLRELYRTLRKEGVLAFATWKSTAWTEVIREAVCTIKGCPPFPSDAELFERVQHGNVWHEEAFIQDQLHKHGFSDVKIEVSAKKHLLARETFVNTFTGPMLKGILQSIWEKQAIDEYHKHIRPAVVGLLDGKGLQGVEVVMTAIIVVARKGDQG